MIVKRFLLVLSLLSLSTGAFAVAPDSLIVVQKGNGWVLQQPLAPGETLFSIARRYNVPPEALAESNRMTNTAAPIIVPIVDIPLGEFNLIHERPRSSESARPIYYRVLVGDAIYVISSWFGVSRELLTLWNEPMPPAGPFPGQVMLVGWVRYDPSSFVAGPATILRENNDDPFADTIVNVPAPVLTEAGTPKTAEPTLEELWKDQTIEGTNVIREKGSAGFFSVQGNAPRAAVYAFHNTASRGTVMLVKNISNGKSIYVKVLGPLPDSKQYAGCVLGLSDGAKAALGVRENKVFVEMGYAGY